MKNLIKILTITLISFNASCQILPLKTPDFDCPNGAYLKDLDGVFPFLEGTWKGIVNNKEYTFQFVSFPHQLVSYSDGNYIYQDKLKCKFKVVNSSDNQILYNDLMINNMEEYKIFYAAYSNNLGYIFIFSDDRNHCNNVVSIQIIKNLTNINQITCKAFEYEEYIRPTDCPYNEQSDIPIFLPNNDLTLTKQ